MIPKVLPYNSYREARERENALIRTVRKHKKIKGFYKFSIKPIGSQKRRCVIQDSKGKYDLDYQIVLSHNCKGSMKPTDIKNAFFEAFRDSAHMDEKVENSTTVVTVRCSKSNNKFDVSKEKFSFDFVIIDCTESYRIKRNGPNEYTWTELPSKNSYIYERFNNLDGNSQRELLEEFVIPRVIKEKNKDKDKRIPSIDIFYEGVNNFYKK